MWCPIGSSRDSNRRRLAGLIADCDGSLIAQEPRDGQSAHALLSELCKKVRVSIGWPVEERIMVGVRRVYTCGEGGEQRYGDSDGGWGVKEGSWISG